jgi:hypothetical protein
VNREYPASALADLYDPLAMPPVLLQAHQDLDRAVDRCYRPKPFPGDRYRVEYLFALYEKLTAPPNRPGKGGSSTQFHNWSLRNNRRLLPRPQTNGR